MLTAPSARPLHATLRPKMAGIALGLLSVASQLGAQAPAMPDSTRGRTETAAARPTPAAKGAETPADSLFFGAPPTAAEVAVALVELDAAHAGRTFLNDVLAESGNMIARWPSGTVLRVWVAPVPFHPAETSDLGVSSGTRAAGEAVVRAFHQWERVDLPLRITFVSDSARANVRVHWLTRFPKDVRVGETTWTGTPDNWLLSGDITLACQNRDGAYFTTEQTRVIALHEVGHLLGLLHSQQPGDIMAAHPQVTELGGRDRRTVQALYRLQAGIFPIE